MKQVVVDSPKTKFICQLHFIAALICSTSGYFCLACDVRYHFINSFHSPFGVRLESTNLDRTPGLSQAAAHTRRLSFTVFFLYSTWNASTNAADRLSRSGPSSYCFMRASEVDASEGCPRASSREVKPFSASQEAYRRILLVIQHPLRGAFDRHTSMAH